MLIIILIIILILILVLVLLLVLVIVSIPFLIPSILCLKAFESKAVPKHDRITDAARWLNLQSRLV